MLVPIVPWSFIVGSGGYSPDVLPLLSQIGKYLSTILPDHLTADRWHMDAVTPDVEGRPVARVKCGVLTVLLAGLLLGLCELLRKYLRY